MKLDPLTFANLIAAYRLIKLVPPGARMFSMDGKLVFPRIGTMGNMTTEQAGFVYWNKKDERPEFLERVSYEFPMPEEGVKRLADGTLTVAFSIYAADSEEQAVTRFTDRMALLVRAIREDEAVA